MFFLIMSTAPPHSVTGVVRCSESRIFVSESATHDPIQFRNTR